VVSRSDRRGTRGHHDIRIRSVDLPAQEFGVVARMLQPNQLTPRGLEGTGQDRADRIADPPRAGQSATQQLIPGDENNDPRASSNL
jgi:hypothetical protein